MVYGKILVLTLNEQDEKVIDKIISAIFDRIQLEPIQAAPVPILSFPGLEVRQHQHRVLRGGKAINLTRLEYGILVQSSLSYRLISKARFGRLFALSACSNAFDRSTIDYQYMFFSYIHLLNLLLI